MGKGNAKKGAASPAGSRPERRKHPRRQSARSGTRKKPVTVESATETCHTCGHELENADRALLVEEEIGRVFCSEDCIAAAFADDIERLEKEYFKHLSPTDMSPDEKEKLTHLRWITLEEPDELWREKTLSGDYRYTLVGEFEPGGFPVWSVCICLFLRGEPSFLYLAFTTKDPELVDHYRRGERIKRQKIARDPGVATASQKRAAASKALLESGAQEGEAREEGSMIDGLADSWTEEETERAKANGTRKRDDIQPSDFELYHGCLEPTLEEPDEVWGLAGEAAEEVEDSVKDEDLSEDSTGDSGDSGDSKEEDEDATVSGRKFYHFIKHFPEEEPGVWFVIVARETDDEEQIEICDAFPTRDPDLVERYRKGALEVGSRDTTATSRTIH